VGFTGATGVPGVPGAQGTQGPQGPPSFTYGANGSPGVQGNTGPPSSVTGPQGPPGTSGAQGAQGPTGPQGPPGDLSAGSPGTPSVSIASLGVNTAAGPTGTLRATSTITSFYSDIRLKDNIEYIKNAGEKLYSLNGIFYKQNAHAEKFGYHDYKKQVGVIAQEVQKVLPEIVTLAPFDIGENEQSKSGENYLTVQYQYLIPLIVETIKEQQREIEALRERLNGN
jgi:hypothetical protein